MGRRKKPPRERGVKPYESEQRRWWMEYARLMDIFDLCDKRHDCEKCGRFELCHNYAESLFASDKFPGPREIWAVLEYIRSDARNGTYYLNKKQAALELNVHHNTMRRWCRKGFIKTVVVGLNEYVPMHEITRFRRMGNFNDKKWWNRDKRKELQSASLVEDGL